MSRHVHIEATGPNGEKLGAWNTYDDGHHEIEDSDAVKAAAFDYLRAGKFDNGKFDEALALARQTVKV